MGMLSFSSAYHLYVKIQLEDVRFAHIGRDVESTDRNSLNLLSSVSVATESIFAKITFTCLFVKNSYTEFYKPTNDLVADTRTNGRTDDRHDIHTKKKGKAIPLQTWTGPEGSRRLRFPDFKTIGT